MNNCNNTLLKNKGLILINRTWILIVLTLMLLISSLHLYTLSAFDELNKIIIKNDLHFYLGIILFLYVLDRVSINFLEDVENEKN